MENQTPNPEPKPTETPKEKWSLKKWFKSLLKKDETKEETTEKEGEPKKEKKSNSWIWWILASLVAIGIILVLIFANPFSSKDGKAKANTEQESGNGSSGPGNGGSGPGNGGSGPGNGGSGPGNGGSGPGNGGSGPGNGGSGPGNPAQPTVQNGLQLTFNYSQTFEWSGLDPKEQTRLKALEVGTDKLSNPINVNFKDIIETGKSRITNYENKGYDMIQLQYIENGTLKTIFTKPSNIAIAL